MVSRDGGFWTAATSDSRPHHGVRRRRNHLPRDGEASSGLRRSIVMYAPRPVWTPGVQTARYLWSFLRPVRGAPSALIARQYQPTRALPRTTLTRSQRGVNRRVRQPSAAGAECGGGRRPSPPGGVVEWMSAGPPAGPLPVTAQRSGEPTRQRRWECEEAEDLNGVGCRSSPSSSRRSLPSPRVAHCSLFAVGTSAASGAVQLAGDRLERLPTRRHPDDTFSEVPGTDTTKPAEADRERATWTAGLHRHHPLIALT
jgi:hypothetical protein